jgi:hypothetical protein
LCHSVKHPTSLSKYPSEILFATTVRDVSKEFQWVEIEEVVVVLEVKM